MKSNAIVILLSFLFLAATGAKAAGISLENLATELRQASDSVIELDPAERAKCAVPGVDACGEWTERAFRSLPYFDTKIAKVTVDQVERLFRVDWNPGRFGGGSFLDRQEALYATYPYRAKDRRYVLPFANLRGWSSLNHPPIREIHQPLSDFHSRLGGPLPEADHPFYTDAFQRRLDALSGTDLTAGNHVDLLLNHDSYLEKLALIGRAKRRLWVTTMVFACDPSSTVLLRALSERAAAGVDVRLIFEGLYAKTAYAACLKTIRGYGIRVLPLTESVSAKNLSHITHSKFWIRDGEEAIVGGQNIVDDENLSTGFNEGYRDTDAWIHEGPAVTDLDAKFAEIWTLHRKEKDLGMTEAKRAIAAKRSAETERGDRGPAVFARLRDPALRSKGLCRILSQDPGGARESIETALTELIGQTRELAIVTTPRMEYDPAKDPRTVPAGPIYAALLEAAEVRGIRVDLITNGADGFGGTTTSKYRNRALEARAEGRPNLENFWRGTADDLGQATSRKSFAAGETFVRRSKNIHGWNYFRYAHQKVHYFDRRMIGIGSFNLDGFSARGNRETELFCMDDSLVQQAERMLARDLANSTPLRK